MEAAIKAGHGKRHVDIDRLVIEIDNSGFRELPVSAQHAATVRRLPESDRDPFDLQHLANEICHTYGYRRAVSCFSS